MAEEARITEFRTARAARAFDGAVLIALFDGSGMKGALLRCSADAALNLIAELATCLRSDVAPQASEPRSM